MVSDDADEIGDDVEAEAEATLRVDAAAFAPPSGMMTCEDSAVAYDASAAAIAAATPPQS